MWNLPDKKIIVVDFETTEATLAAARGEFPQIVEIGACLFNNELEIEDTFTSFVKPMREDEFTEFSEKLTGITPDDLKGAPTWKQVWPEFAKFTKFNNLHLAAWGSDFDIAVLKQMYYKHMLGYPHHAVAFDVRSMVYAMAAEWGLKLTSWKLQDVAKKLEFTMPTWHRALRDAMTACNIIRRLGTFGEEHQNPCSYQWNPSSSET